MATEITLKVTRIEPSGSPRLWKC